MKIDGKTKPIAIVGNPLGHTLSPLMHNYFFRSLGLNNIYIPLTVEEKELSGAIKGLWSLGFKGANITIPFKEKAMEYLAEVSEEARLIGAVNTLVWTPHGFRGENTDGRGFLKFLQEEKRWLPRHKKALILGAGGSARAISTILALKGIDKITIANRTLVKAQIIADKIVSHIGTPVEIINWEEKKLKKMVNDADIIINTTPLGMKPFIDACPPINTEWLGKGQLVVDIIYNPLMTRFLAEAFSKGCDTANGLGMLIYQGALAFEHWTGQKPPLEGVRELLEKELLGS
ncbi:MAG: shikimate dehydrogenase [Clostridia bacterium]|nr:shikimate dehydrogenase [Clostridia bacterium]